MHFDFDPGHSTAPSLEPGAYLAGRGRLSNYVMGLWENEVTNGVNSRFPGKRKSEFVFGSFFKINEINEMSQSVARGDGWPDFRNFENVASFRIVAAS